jgi:hypothetical protein
MEAPYEPRDPLPCTKDIPAVLLREEDRAINGSLRSLMAVRNLGEPYLGSAG